METSKQPTIMLPRRLIWNHMVFSFFLLAGRANGLSVRSGICYLKNYTNKDRGRPDIRHAVWIEGIRSHGNFQTVRIAIAIRIRIAWIGSKPLFFCVG